MTLAPALVPFPVARERHHHRRGGAGRRARHRPRRGGGAPRRHRQPRPADPRARRRTWPRGRCPSPTSWSGPRTRPRWTPSPTPASTPASSPPPTRSACRSLVGAMANDPLDDEQVLNQGIVYQPGLGSGDRYTKRHPVPYGEYIPFRGSLIPSTYGKLRLVPRDMARGTGLEPLRVGDVRVADAICFDVAYDEGIAGQVARGAELVDRADQQRDVQPDRAARPAVRDQPPARAGDRSVGGGGRDQRHLGDRAARRLRRRLGARPRPGGARGDGRAELDAHPRRTPRGVAGTGRRWLSSSGTRWSC